MTTPYLTRTALLAYVGQPGGDDPPEWRETMSEEAKFQSTPGPWVARPEWQSPYGVPIYAEAVNERDEREHVGNVYRAGDARLVAAAPDLLAALRMGLEIGDQCSRGFLAQFQAKARAIIAKAEGREP